MMHKDDAVVNAYKCGVKIGINASGVNDMYDVCEHEHNLLSSQFVGECELHLWVSWWRTLAHHGSEVISIFRA